MGRNMLRITGALTLGTALALLVHDMRSGADPGYLWLVVGGAGTLLWHCGSRQPTPDGR